MRKGTKKVESTIDDSMKGMAEVNGKTVNSSFLITPTQHPVMDAWKAYRTVGENVVDGFGFWTDIDRLMKNFYRGDSKKKPRIFCATSAIYERFIGTEDEDGEEYILVKAPWVIKAEEAKKESKNGKKDSK